MNYAENRNEIEYLFLDGKLTIVPKRKRAGPIQLSAEDLDWLLDFLTAVGALAGYVKFVPDFEGVAPIYRLKVNDPVRLKETVAVDMVIHNGEIEDISPVGSYSRLNGDEEGQ